MIVAVWATLETVKSDHASNPFFFPTQVPPIWRYGRQGVNPIRHSCTNLSHDGRQSSTRCALSYRNKAFFMPPRSTPGLIGRNGSLSATSVTNQFVSLSHPTCNPANRPHGFSLQKCTPHHTTNRLALYAGRHTPRTWVQRDPIK